MKLCDKIAKLRKIKGFSQEEFANKLDVSRQAVFKWESGENTPDLEKIKKIAKLFNISLDVLLDDEKDISYSDEIKKTASKSKEIKFRKSFDSGIKLKTLELANIENGYIEGKKKTNEKIRFSVDSSHKELIKKKGYSKIIRIQHDVCVDFFIDEKNKTFGFFFDGAPQFLCPFENLAAVSISNSGLSTGYTSTPIVGVGFGRNPSIGVGSMPLSQTRLPHSYDCSISYFDENGSLCDYKISFGCHRTYILYNDMVKNVDELYLWENLLSEETNKNLNDVSSCLQGIKEAGLLIKNGHQEVTNVNIASYLEEVKAGQKRKKSINNELITDLELSNKRKKKIWLTILIVLCCGFICTVTTCSIKKAVETKQIQKENNEKAQATMDKIDSIGEVTLDSYNAIVSAENSYNSLTNEQKALVSNYYKLTNAKNKYENLMYEKREEETKDDPTRTIVVTDLNGSWKSSSETWNIGNINGGTAVLYYVSGQMAGVISGSLPSSYVVGYNNETKRMELKLYHYTAIGGEWLNVTMTKSSSNELTLFYRTSTFYKI